MRYYFIDDEKQEYKLDLTSTRKINGFTRSFIFSYNEGESKEITIRNLSGKYYASEDGLNWRKLATMNLPDNLLYVNKVYGVYRGYKPSGLSSENAGDLVTQMPGKVVKVLGEVGSKVSEGQAILILEAMKMENEIKSNMNGHIKAIHVSEGQAIEAGTLMIEIEE